MPFYDFGVLTLIPFIFYNSFTDGLPNNTEFEYLYKASALKPISVSLIVTVPEYMDALRGANHPLTDTELYNLFKPVLINMVLNRKKKKKAAIQILKELSLITTGDKNSWKSDLPEE